jgi:Zn-dependent protease
MIGRSVARRTDGRTHDVPAAPARPGLRIAGFDLRVTPATLITVLLVAVLWNPTYASLGDVGSVVASLGTGVLLLVSVLVHELFHALAARALGQTVDHIELNLFGGHTQYRGRALNPWGSLLISVAGPIANLLLWWLCSTAADLLRSDGGSPSGAGVATGVTMVLVGVAWLNLILGIFNLIPGLPLDGGNALRSLLRGVGVPSTPATLATGAVGLLLAAALLLFPIVQFLLGSTVGIAAIWSVLLALFLGQAAWQAIRRARAESSVAGLGVDQVARPLAVLPAGAPVSEADRALQAGAIVVARGAGGSLLRLDVAAAGRVPTAARHLTPLSAVLRPVGRVARISSRLSGVDLVRAAAGADADLFLVEEEVGTTGRHGSAGTAAVGGAGTSRGILGEDLKEAARRHVERRPRRS